jgi:uncharacterized protein (TIGR02145 family)
MTGKPVSGADQNNYTTEAGGLLLPRVKLESTNSLAPFLTVAEAIDSLKYLLAGLMVYNITASNPSLYPAVYTWDGSQWKTSEANEVNFLAVARQPEPFIFCESGGGDITLTFNVNGGVNPKFQWFQITSTNVHVRVGDTIKTNSIGSGYDTQSLTLGSSILRGVNSTKDARYCGLYRFYCIVTDDLGQRVESNTAEVAVGCGAKNNDGNWLSFMCFNLGADNNSTIASQTESSISFQNDSTSGRHTYISYEENLYGSLFQWGRIADGHEILSGDGTNLKATATYNSAALAPVVMSGNACPGISDPNRPVNQVHIDSVAWYGKFIIGSTNWNPATEQATLDRLWQTYRFIPNDPCAHYKTDGSYQPFWYTDTSGNTACTAAGTNWRLPTQEEWAAIYRGTTVAGRSDAATANTWSWRGSYSYSGGKANVTRSGGYEIKPDGKTSTLFLPANGYRYGGTGVTNYQGTLGYYWSSSVTDVSAYHLNFNNATIRPGNAYDRAYGMAIRCIKNT